jgi:quinolinate synthase
MKVCIVLSAMHFIAETWKLLTPSTLKNSFVKCGCPVDILVVMMMCRNLLKMKKVTGIVHTVFWLSTSKVCGV